MRGIAYPQEVLTKTPTLGTRTDDEGGDGYREKIAKYVPAETLAFVIPLATQPDNDADRKIIVAVAIVGTIIFNLLRNEKTTWYFHVLALIALLCWLIGATNFGVELLGLSDFRSRLILAAAVFLIPGLDAALTKFFSRRA